MSQWCINDNDGHTHTFLIENLYYHKGSPYRLLLSPQHLAQACYNDARGTWCGTYHDGVDLHWDTTYAEEQKAALLIQVDWAKKYNLPLILHCRKALDLVIEMMEKEYDENLKGIFHCFDGNFFQAKKISEIPNFKMGIGGNITYKKSTLPEVLENIDLQHIVLETDSPYLPPTPHRGKRNESSYLTLVAQKLAEIKGVGLREIARITNENAKEIFCSQTYSR